MSVPHERKTIQAPATSFYQAGTTKQALEREGKNVGDFMRAAGLNEGILSKLPLGGGQDIKKRSLTSLSNIEKEVLYETYGLYNYYLDIYYINKFGEQLEEKKRTEVFNDPEVRGAIEAKVAEYLDDYKSIDSGSAEAYLRHLPSVYMRKRVEADRAISQVKEIGVTGTGAICPRCNSTNFIHDTEQTRRGDEQATAKAKCLDCGLESKS